MIPNEAQDIPIMRSGRLQHAHEFGHYFQIGSANLFQLFQQPFREIA
jgi:hypothetical protein